MALTGLDIYKHLPKTNCKECGVATCLAFAMKVAGGQAGLDQCPRLDDKAREALSDASAPPQRLVTIGAGDKAIQVGQETVLYRHEEKFHHPTILAICLNDNLAPDALVERCREIAALKFERLGATLQVDAVALYNVSEDARTFTDAAKTASRASGKVVVLVSPHAGNLRAAGEALKSERPLLWAMQAGADGVRENDAIAVAKDLGLPLCLEAPGFDALAAAAEAARSEGLKELMLSPGQVETRAGLEFLAQSRRAAIGKKFRPMGFPVAMPVLDGDPPLSIIKACWYILKYAGLVVVRASNPEEILGILTTRQDIYTDPQIPVQVQPGLHVVGDPGEDAPVLVTTNFALSYYSVESEVEASRVPSYIVSVDTEGTSVLTAWAADKLNAETIAKAVKNSGVESKVRHKRLVLPGHVAVLSASTSDESGWEALVGPKEASGLVSYLKTQWKA
jgi:acetyl-CoA decarbonylase/synthase complex subunit gamma